MKTRIAFLIGVFALSLASAQTRDGNGDGFTRTDAVIAMRDGAQLVTVIKRPASMTGALPFLLLAVLVAGQLAIAGHTLWSAGIAARAGARSRLVGGRAETAARAALPPPMRAGARVGAGGETVEVPVPRLLPGMPRVTVEAGTRLGPG